MKALGTHKYLERAITLFAAICLPMCSFGATGQASNFSNPLFNTLLVIIVVLALFIIGLASALKSVIGSDLFIERLKREKSSQVNKTLIMFFFLGATLSLSAQGAVIVAEDTIGGLHQATFYTMICIIAAEVLVMSILVHTFKNIAGPPQYKKVNAPVKKNKPVLDKINNTVPIEEEEKITLDHVYDGIRELDNDLPPWWKYGFYLTIVVAFVYLIAYHITGSLPLQVEEYRTSVKKGEAAVAEFMKTSANNVDETTVKLLTEKSDLNAGKDLFISTCSACHGRAGEGGVGPNLTDDYWMHQGGVSDIFKTIKYGWPDKGMKSWKEDFSPMQIAQLTSFIKSIKGTNPPNAKDKQGDLYTETVTVPADSLRAKPDSLSKLTSQIK
jgi:cytochrome c oxidase cbb3-type subunit 3